MRNSVLEELRVRRLADIQEEMSCRAVWRWEILESKLREWKEKKVEYHGNPHDLTYRLPPRAFLCARNVPKYVCGLGAAPNPAGGAYSTPRSPTW